jgi:hypothetical protein
MPLNTLKIYKMTHSEDIKRTRGTIEHYQIARIEALERRVKYLEQIIETEYLNKEQ